MTTRRDIVKLLAAAPLASLAVSAEDVERAAAAAAEAVEQGRPFRPAFFSPDEWRLVRLLADIVIPRDARSGSATDAAVPQFMDFMMTAYPEMQKPMRDGLAWLNEESRSRFGGAFVAVTAAQRTAILDEIAYPARAAEELRPGVTFFTRFRDLTASGFWSSRIGVADLEYRGNTALARWTGCPPAALRKLGVSYT
ncbi:MAG: gluconate 2-dehydrogenase subunit 3 family protein [Gemmatimonadota bacterium]